MRNPIAAWLDELGLFGLRSHEKFVPGDVFCLPKGADRPSSGTSATDGSVTVNKSGRGGRIYYGSTSRRLVDDLSRLLLRFGIQTRIRSVKKGEYRRNYTLDISGVDSQRRFLRRSASTASGEWLRRLLEIVRGLTANTNVDTVPKQVGRRPRGDVRSGDDGPAVPVRWAPSTAARRSMPGAVSARLSRAWPRCR